MSSSVAPPSAPLRERSKARRRFAVQRAALRLFAERGYDGTTIAEIAEDAEVAARSVLTYFPSKLEIALSTSSEIVDRLVATFEAHPELDFLAVVDRWLLAERDVIDPELAALTLAMFDANPDLRAVSLSHFGEAARVTREALLAEVGLPPQDPLLPVVLAASGAAINEYLTTVLQARMDDETHHRFMRYLRAIIAAARPASVVPSGSWPSM